MSEEGQYIPKAKETKYEPWMCEKIIEVAQNGGHVAQMCAEIGIKSRDTFYRWLKEYPEFNEAYETSKLRSQAFYENVLLMGMLGKIKNFNFNSLAMTLNNKFPTDYQRNANAPSTNISIGSINNIDQLEGKELDEKIKELQNKVQLLDDRSEDS